MKTTLLACGLLASTFLAAHADVISLTDADLASAYKTIKLTRVSVHDPSIVSDTVSSATPAYYVFGSHLGCGKSANLYNWNTNLGSGVVISESSGCTLFANPSGQRVSYDNAYTTQQVTRVKNCDGEEVDFPAFDAHAWQSSGYSVRGNQWAPDIIWNPTMGKWLMYMSVNGDKWCSSIVCLAADRVTGPYVYQGLVVCSGFHGYADHNGYNKTDDWKRTDVAIATGCTALPARYKQGGSWGSYWPNCIDPCVFYDEEGKLWMSYGSWSGGIFMLELDETTGLRDYTVKYPITYSSGGDARNQTSDPYFGKKIAGGWYVSGEGSYIEYIGGWYYLFISYGGFAPDGGYEMRIFRSQSPTGPYKDCYGTVATETAYEMNYGVNAKTNRGTKIMGGYQWDLMKNGELSQGHNSAFTDPKGRSFVIYHTKFNDGTAGHQVRVHQLFQNQDGWLVVTPHDFYKETVTQDSIEAREQVADDEIPGTYQLIFHKYNQDYANMQIQKPINITLSASEEDSKTGNVEGGVKGTWKRTANTDFIEITVSGVTYKGVLTHQTVDNSNIQTVSISALSSSSGSITLGQNNFTRQRMLWASKAEPKAAIKYTIDQMVVPFANGSTISSDQTLPTKGYLGATVKWESSDLSIMTKAGVVRGEGDVTMTATISKDNYEYVKSYNLHVIGEGSNVVPVYYPECGSTNFSNGWWQTFSDNYVLQADKEVEFKFYNYTKGTANYQNWCLYGASTGPNQTGYKEYFGIRADNWDNTSGSNNGCTSNYNWDTFATDMNGSMVDMNCKYSSDGKFEMNAAITTKTGKNYTYKYTKTIADKPASIVLFFVTEASYITRGDIDAIEEISSDTDNSDNCTYDLLGRQIHGNQPMFNNNGSGYNSAKQPIFIYGGKIMIKR